MQPKGFAHGTHGAKGLGLGVVEHSAWALQGWRRARNLTRRAAWPAAGSKHLPQMNKVIWFLAVPCVLVGQTPGQSTQQVKQAFGSPQLSRHTGNREIWMYRDGRRVTFENGVVVTASGGRSSGSEAVTEAGTAGTESVAATSTEPAEVEGNPVSSGFSFHDERRHLRFNVPPGFVAGQAADAAVFAAWLRPLSDSADYLGLSVAEGEGALAAGPIPDRFVPPGCTRFTVPWQGAVLNCYRLERGEASASRVYLQLLLPIAGRKVVRLTCEGPKSGEPVVRDLLMETVSTLDVPLVYLATPKAPAEPWGELTGQIVGTLAALAIGVGILTGTFKLTRKRRKPPPLPL